MDTSLVAVIIGAVATLTVAVVGPLIQRDSRKMALQEAELRTKLNPESSEAKSLDRQISRRKQTWGAYT